jgi:hypothetical protein
MTNNTHLTDEQRVDWLRLIRSDNVGPRGMMAQMPQTRDWVDEYRVESARVVP